MHMCLCDIDLCNDKTVLQQIGYSVSEIYRFILKRVFRFIPMVEITTKGHLQFLFFILLLILPHIKIELKSPLEKGDLKMTRNASVRRLD